jgi:hypothetical protein
MQSAGGSAPVCRSDIWDEIPAAVCAGLEHIEAG